MSERIDPEYHEEIMVLSVLVRATYRREEHETHRIYEACHDLVPEYGLVEVATRRTCASISHRSERARVE